MEWEEAGDLIHTPAGGMKGGPMRTHRGGGILIASFEAVESTIIVQGLDAVIGVQCRVGLWLGGVGRWALGGLVGAGWWVRGFVVWLNQLLACHSRPRDRESASPRFGRNCHTARRLCVCVLCVCARLCVRLDGPVGKMVDCECVCAGCGVPGGVFHVDL